LGLEPAQFISEGYCQHALKYLGIRKKYADIGTRNNTVYFRRLLANAFDYLGFRKKYADIGTRTKQFISEGYCQHAVNYLGCRKKYTDIGTRTNTVYFRSLLLARLKLAGLQKEI